MTTCPNCGTLIQTDGRARSWRVRLRLYRAGIESPEADSDPELSPESPGAESLPSLPAIIPWLRDTATAFHGCEVDGLQHDTLVHRLRSVRPLLSRREKEGRTGVTWRVPYTVGDTGWMARVDIVRGKQDGDA